MVADVGRKWVAIGTLRRMSPPHPSLESSCDPSLLPTGYDRVWSEETSSSVGSKSSLRRSRPGRARSRPRRAVARDRERRAAPTPNALAERERETGTTSPRSSTRWPRRLGEEGRWLHYGLTSSDVAGHGALAPVQEAGALLLEGIDRAFEAVATRAEEHRLTLCMGRTHGIHAEPTTFGLKLAGWAFELERDRERRRPCSRGHARRQALGRRRHLCRDRPGARAARL